MVKLKIVSSGQNSTAEVRKSREWIIRRLIKVGAKVVYHGRQWQVHVASAFPLFRRYEALFG